MSSEQMCTEGTERHQNADGRADRVTVFKQTQTAQPSSKPLDVVNTHPNVKPLPIWFSGATTVLADGRLLSLENGHVRISSDDGQTWNERSMWPGKDPIDSRHGILIRTRGGTLVFIFLDIDNQLLEWNDDKHMLQSEPRLDVLVARSQDDGATWSEPRKMFAGYCGCLINVIQTRSGRLVVPVQVMVGTPGSGLGPGRHVQTTCVSDDEGVTWRQSNMIDIGGHGHHDGCFEGAVTQLGDGRLWMLLRTNLDYFWQAWSEDEGLSWRTIQPTRFDASSSPPNLLCLQSGRLAMFWNRLYPEGLTDEQKAQWERGGGELNISEPVSSWHRRELSMAFTDDDGEHWTKPLVLARGNQISYAHVFERRPGEVWLATQFGPRVSLRFLESDLVAAARAGGMVKGACT